MDGEAARTCAQTHTDTSPRIQDALTGEGKESVEVCQKAFSQNPNKTERRPGPLASQRSLSLAEAAGLLECGNKKLALSLGLKSIPLPPSPHFSDALGALVINHRFLGEGSEGGCREAQHVFFNYCLRRPHRQRHFFFPLFNWQPLFLCGFKRLLAD